MKGLSMKKEYIDMKNRFIKDVKNHKIEIKMYDIEMRTK